MPNNEARAQTSETCARIGPNALIRLGEAVRNIKGEAACNELFQAAGLSRYLDAPPDQMVPEEEVKALHRALYGRYPREEAERLLAVAGVLTARYLVANRIPKAARRVIRALPRRLGGRILLSAIRKNSWTFAGSATVAAKQGRSPALLMQKCRLCAGLDAAARPCRYHQATIETLFRTIVSPQARVDIHAFCPERDDACAFEISW